ncbi:hypothetical protein HDF16_001817 [Granulicella aggregans]|uniref:DUF4139 domain-containing protein n=1 Tax=Granulicella aggregans TaxID=474949 RepID=A0A7W7ZCA6_9BACT|nr:hypothetical protein [Granulicella aggregans]MBB5057132.1 hypothetical protein [Granulicella aggregans]
MRAPLVLLAFAASVFAQTNLQVRKTLPKSEAHSGELPITRVALYKNGVGFFEHVGHVIGDQSVTIDFTSPQLNDVLQSLTAIDLNGGRISGAGYNSTTPLDQQLKTLPLALNGDPSDVDFYNAIRGARVSVTGVGAGITGRLLSIDLRAAKSKDTDPNATSSNDDRRFVTVISESGQVRTVELTPTVSVALLDTALHTDVTRYLELLASTRNQGLRHLTLLDRGTGSRELRVSYISEVPVWKSTYRILFSQTAAGTTTDATLQGWSVVDNTTGSDWTNVHLDLIAGAPQSFIQPLSTPYYTRRPEIPLPAEAQLSPQTHESGGITPQDAVAPAPPRGVAEMSSTVEVNGPPMAMAGPIPMSKRDRFFGGGVGSGSGNGMGPGSGGNTGGGIFRPGTGAVSYEQAATNSNSPQTTTSAFDDFFEYSLTDPITIRKNESALVPILQTKLPIERVTLWSPSEPVALRALWITNSSNLTLDRGSFSIVENGSFGGEGLLDPIHPGEKRLLSYAADQAVRVTTDHTNNTRRVIHLTIKNGMLTESSTDVAEVEYLVRNAAPDARLVIVEQPVRQGWTLDSDPKPAETTPTVYRFRVATKPQETVHLHIGERHTNYEYIRLVDRSIEQITLLIKNAKASPAVLAALQPVFDIHNKVVGLDEQIRAREADVAEIAKDQDRLRENMKALKGSAEERDLLKRYTGGLNAQEDKLAAFRSELATLHAQRTAADAEFQAKLGAIDIDEAI